MQNDKYIQMKAGFCALCSLESGAGTCNHVIRLSGLKALKTTSTIEYEAIVEREHYLVKSIRKLKYYELAADMSPESFKAAIGRLLWISAKTMPQNPHAYALLRNSKSLKDKAVFLILVAYIKMNSVVEMFKGHPYDIYYAGDGFKYWSMDDTLESTDLINRKDEGIA